jgi:hypothetical protein
MCYNVDKLYEFIVGEGTAAATCSSRSLHLSARMFSQTLIPGASCVAYDVKHRLKQVLLVMGFSVGSPKLVSSLTLSAMYEPVR